MFLISVIIEEMIFLNFLFLELSAHMSYMEVIRAL